MRLSSREAVLSWVVSLLVLLSLTYWYIAPKVRIWAENVESRKQMVDRIALTERLLQSQEQWVLRLDTLKTKLVKYAAEQDVTADYLKILERVAKDNNVNLGRRQPQKEKRHGDLYELAINCTWEGDLNALVRFLFALEQESVAVDIEDLTVSMMPGGKNQMRGNFTLMCIYSRSGSASSEEKSPGPKPAKPRPYS